MSAAVAIVHMEKPWTEHAYAEGLVVLAAQVDAWWHLCLSP